jgi:serralysin
MKILTKTLTVSISALLVFQASTSKASFHLYDIKEVYSNSDGSVQFIEMFTASAGQQVLLNHKLTLVGTANEFTFPSNGPSPTTNTHLLIGTANLGTLYGVTPDFVLTANFLSGGAGISLNFDNQDSLSLLDLPFDGVRSLDGVFNNGNAPSVYNINAAATPTNFAGDTATIPEPTTGILALLGTGFALLGRRRLA